MATTSAMCVSFKAEVGQALHNFTASTGNAFKIALIKVAPAGTYGVASTNYSNITGNTDEVTGTGYSAGGTALTNVTPLALGSVGYWTFSPDPSWTTATFSTSSAMIYNTTNGNRAVSTHDFGGTQSVTSGTFTVIMPPFNSTTALLRIT